MQERICQTCGKTFKPTTANQVYCPPTTEQRARVKGQPRSRCAKRAGNHAQRTMEGRDTIPLDAPIVVLFDCSQCGRSCVPGVGGVASHASKFCGYDCKTKWHDTNPSGANLRWARTVGVERKRERAAAERERVAMERLLDITNVRGAEMAYRRSLRADPCAYCSGPSGASDHIVPKADGGPDNWTNRTGACHRCNNQKQNTPLLIFLGWKRAREEFEPWRAIVAELCTRKAA